MLNKVIIKEDDSRKVEYIYEELLSIEALAKTLMTDNELFNENSDLYKKMVADYNETKNRFNECWIYIAKTYSIDENNIHNCHLDFGNYTITIKG